MCRSTVGSGPIHCLSGGGSQWRPAPVSGDVLLIGWLDTGRRRPKPAKLASNHQLREVVEEKLEDPWSPRQISEWLFEAYPDSEGMRVSHETI